MKTLILALAFLGGPLWNWENRRHVDLIEYNHVYVNGRHAFSQIIFWEKGVFSARKTPQSEKSVTGMRVIAWAMYDTRMNPNQKPPYKQNGLWEYHHMTDSGRFLVVSRNFRESWSEIDAERDDSRRMGDWHRYELFTHSKEFTTE